MTAAQERLERIGGRRPRSRWTRSIQLIAFIMAAITVGVSAGAAWAYWLATTTPGSNGAAAATSVNSGATPTASAVGPTVTVSWAASTLATGQAVSGYLVKRYDATTLVVQTILAGCSGTIAATSCVESSVPSGSWKYTVTPVFATNWAGAESAKSATVTVDATPPTNAISLSNVSGGAWLSGTTIYYAGTNAGSLTLTNTVADAGSGPASSQTTALTGTTTGFTHAPSTVSTPAGGPYVSAPFAWTAGTSSGPGEAVTGRDVAGNTATTNLTFANDSTAPSAGSISYLDGYQPGLSVAVTFAAGTDGGSGIATRQLQRSFAQLTNGTCGTFNSFTNIGVDNPSSPYTDTALSNSTCYKYRFVVTDHVGNQTIATSSNVSKVDYAGAVNTTTGLLSQWRLGEASASLISSDSFTGTTGTALSSHTGELGATWVQASGLAPAQIDGNRIHRSGLAGDTVDYVTAAPPSANYSVEADLYVRSILAGDDTGVIGRRNGSNNFYLARWDQTTGRWQLGKYNGLAVTVLASSGATSLTALETYRVKLEMTGSTLNLYVNGILTVTTTDSSLSAAGNAGIMDGDGALSASKSSTTGLHIDNFQVTPSTYPRAADSKGSNTGDYKNGVTLGVAGALAGDTNTAAQFDGVNDYVQMVATTGLPTGAAVRSTELWFKTTSSAQQVLFAYGASGNTQEYGLWLGAGATTMTAWGYGGGNDIVFTMPAALNDGQWHQVIETYNGTTLTLYIDGTALTPQAATRSTVLDMYGFSIGAILRSSDGNYGEFFTGSIDEVSFYTTTLNQTTVTNHYQLGRAPGADVTGPTGGSVDATGLVGTGSRYSISTTLSIALAKGSDPSGLATSGNVLQRATATLTSSGTVNGVCGTYGSYSPIATDPSTPYSDTVADQACYSYRYIVMDALGNATTYSSGDIKVDTTAPTAPTLAYSAFTNTYWNGPTLYYRSGAGSGSFTVTASSADGASGVSSYSFPSLGTNWTGTPGALGVETYSWSGAPAVPGTVSVTATNFAGRTSAAASFTPTADSTAPSGGSVSYVNGSTGGTTVSVTFAAGTDSGSGLGTALLQRASAPLTGITCGTFGAFATVTGGTNPTSPLTDTVTAGNCYKYQYVVSDNVGNTTTYSSASVAHYPYGAFYAFDAGSGTTAVDTFGNSNTGTLQTGAGWTTGIVGTNALNLNGTTGYVDVANPVIDTSQSYTVATWVKLNNLTGFQTFASIDGTSASAFYLQMQGGKFAMTVRSTDSTTGTETKVTQIVAPSTGVWYHVVGVYDSSAQTIALYVNGQLQGTASFTTAWKGTGHTAIGRGKWSGGNVDFTNGALDETHFYDRVLSASEIAGLATGTNAYYTFDAGSGTTAADSSGKGNTGTLQAGAGWTTGKVGSGALNLNGTSTGWVDVPTPVINTSQSYTVAGWIKLNNVSGYQSLVGIDGAVASPFVIQTDGATGMFRFALESADNSAPGFTNIEGVTPVVGTWYHLVGVYDKTANTMTFYVNGVSQGTVTAPTTWAATGHTAIGRAQYNGAQVDFVNGAIDDVRFYSRALSAAEVAALP
jgi:hypothetical protein